jgi:hypothetical protein
MSHNIDDVKYTYQPVILANRSSAVATELYGLPWVPSIPLINLLFIPLFPTSKVRWDTGIPFPYYLNRYGESFLILTCSRHIRL